MKKSSNINIFHRTFRDEKKILFKFQFIRKELVSISQSVSIESSLHVFESSTLSRGVSFSRPWSSIKTRYRYPTLETFSPFYFSSSKQLPPSFWAQWSTEHDTRFLEGSRRSLISGWRVHWPLNTGSSTVIQSLERIRGSVTTKRKKDL